MYNSITDVSLLSTYQRHILVHSHIYYNLNNSVISDKDFDKLCVQVLKLIKDSPNNTSEYSDAFEGFDGTTGFDLFDKLTDVQKEKIDRIACNVLKRA